MLKLMVYNVNPKGKKTCDCVVRAIAYASGQSWEKVYRDLVEISISSGYMLNEKRCEDKYLESIGFEKHKQPRKFDNTKYLVKEIDKLVDTNEYDVIVSMAGHRTAIDGKYIIDIWDCGYKTVGNYYTRKKDSKRTRPANNGKEAKK